MLGLQRLQCAGRGGSGCCMPVLGAGLDDDDAYDDKEERGVQSSESVSPRKGRYNNQPVGFGIISIDTKASRTGHNGHGMPVLQSAECLAFWARPRGRRSAGGRIWLRSARSCEKQWLPMFSNRISVHFPISFPLHTPYKPFHTQHRTSSSTTTTRSSRLC